MREKEREREREREKESELNPTQFTQKKFKTEERYMFDGSFIFQCVSTSMFCLKTKSKLFLYEK